MTELVRTERSPATPLALPETGLSIRPAMAGDLPFIDGLQKRYQRELGFFPRQQLVEYIERGWVLLAEERATGQAVGYVASRDRYLKRDELGAIYQLCVAPGVQRKLVGAALVQAVLARAPWGCRLYCCWCAQDLPANRFWEAMGFVPIAFRTGGVRRRMPIAECRVPNETRVGNRESTIGNARVHIFWQRRVRAGDGTTPWWYPCSTNGGAIRADRIVLPIPAGVRWDEAMPVVLPGPSAMDGPGPGVVQGTGEANAIGGSGAGGARAERKALPRVRRGPRVGEKAPAAESRPCITTCGLRFASAPVEARAAGAAAVAGEARLARGEPQAKERATSLDATRDRRPKRAAVDPGMVSAARELRDRWLERVNAGTIVETAGKYEVGRAVVADATDCGLGAAGRPVRLLAA